MNKFVDAIKALNITTVKEIVGKDPKWLKWTDAKGRNALHFLGGVEVGIETEKAEASVRIVKYLLESGMDINSVQKIPDPNCGYFEAAPLWYAYTRGRNEKLYKYLLKQGANPDGCMWAIAWYDDIDAAKLFIKHGATLDRDPTKDELFLGAFAWKKYRFAEWLLKEGANVNVFDPKGLNALMFAVKRKEEDTVRMLLKYGADANKANTQGISAKKLAEQKAPKRIHDLL